MVLCGLQQLHLTSFRFQFASRLSALLKHNKPQNKYLFLFFSQEPEGFEIQTRNMAAQSSADKSNVTKRFSLLSSQQACSQTFLSSLKLAKNCRCFYFFIFHHLENVYLPFCSPSVVYLILCEGWWLFAVVIRLFPLRNITAKWIHYSRFDFVIGKFSTTAVSKMRPSQDF